MENKEQLSELQPEKTKKTRTAKKQPSQAESEKKTVTEELETAADPLSASNAVNDTPSATQATPSEPSPAETPPVSAEDKPVEEGKKSVKVSKKKTEINEHHGETSEVVTEAAEAGKREEVLVEVEMDDKAETMPDTEEVLVEAEMDVKAETMPDVEEEPDKSVETQDEPEVSRENMLPDSVKAGSEGQGKAAKEETESEKEEEAKKEDGLGAKKTEEEEEEEESDEEDEGEELFERYSKLSRAELVEVIEALVKEEDVNQIRPHIGYIRIAFRKLLKDESEADYEKRLHKDEDHEETVEEVADVLTERFETAVQVYRDKKSLYDQALEQQKQENLESKEKILEELRGLIESEEELKKTYDQFRDLQEKWRGIGAVPQGSKGTLWNNYHFLVEKFFDKVKINKELKDLDLKKNLEAKTELCEKAEELLLETSIARSFQQLQKLHEAWKETGPVPNDKKDELWERFKSATEKLNKRRQDYYDTLREEQNKNYSAKLILCEKVEHLAAVIPQTPKQWQQLTEQINELFGLWKTIGFAPKKVNNEIWNRFRSSLDSFYRNKKDYFKKYKEHQTENYNQKLNLCLQAEALKDSEDWRSTTEELISLQKEWKKIGPVPAKFSDKIWKRFRAACDEFFNKKADHFSNIGDKQDENLKMKKELINRVRNYAYSDDNTANLKLLKDFQREWMDIGHVPIKMKDKIQHEFRKAIDEQFEKLNISKKVKSAINFRSKLDNLKNAPNADSLIYKERNFVISKINTIQSDIKIWENNIGFFASSPKADILKAEFEEKIEKGRQEIALLEEKLKILREV